MTKRMSLTLKNTSRTATDSALRGMMWWMRYAMSEKSQLNFWSQRPEVTLQLNIGTIVMGVFLKNHKSEQLPFLIHFSEKGDKRMSFFTTSVTGLKTVVTAIGAGVGVWGVINLLEGYGNDNPGANAHVW